MWEYRLIALLRSECEEALNEYGKGSWEVIDSWPADGNRREFLLKRRNQD